MQGSIQWFNKFRRVMWACRVSLASLAFGFILFLFVPQARDLLIDFPAARGWMLYVAIGWHAVLLAAAVFLFWAFPVFHAARKALDNEHWIGSVQHAVQIKPRLDPLILHLPAWLGIMCFGAVIAGIWLLDDDLYDSSMIRGASLARGQLLAHFGATFVAGLLFCFVVWDRSKIHDSNVGQPTDDQLASYLPMAPIARAGSFKWARWIGASCLLLLTAIVVSLFVSPATRFGFDRALLLPLVLGTWVPVIGWLSRLSYRAGLPLVIFAFGGAALFTAWWGDGHEIRVMPETTVDTGKSVPRSGTQWYLDTAVAQWARANDCELENAQVQERAEYFGTTVKVEKAVQRDDRPCPSPVIVAAAGGASRAAFITAATLGTLLDATCRQQPNDGRLGCVERPIFANRLFAISGVSGGSLGAAAYAVALAATAENSKVDLFAPPCDPNDVAVQQMFFRTRPPRTWRDCLEAIVSGDFLSSTAIGLVIRDPIPFLRGWLSADLDRAALLEDEWSSWLDSRIIDGNRGYFRRPFSSFGPREGDWRPLLIFNGTSALTGKRILTSHLTPNHSVTHGDTEKRFRIFQDAYDIRELFEKPLVEDERKCDRLDSREKQADPLSPFAGRDFALATAVTNSARFPFISPAGTISCERIRKGWWDRLWRWVLGKGREVVDHVVDGGYFENFGATTAMDLARGLESFGLKPLILVISNEPLAGRQARFMLADACAPLPPDATDEPWLNKIFKPAGALYQTRDARGSYAVRNLAWSLRTQQARGGGCKASLESDQIGPVFHVTVHQEAGFAGTAKSVSMSWWLSKVVQEFIDYQIPDIREDLGQPRKSKLEIFKGRMDNVRHIFNLCKAIGANAECGRFFEGLPLTLEDQAKALSQIESSLRD